MLKVSEIIERRGLKSVLSLKGLAGFTLKERKTEGRVNRLAAKYSPARSKSAIEARVNYTLSDLEKQETIKSLKAIRDSITLIIYDLEEM